MQVISEAHLLTVIEQMLEQFRFEILGFNSDNGSEYVNEGSKDAGEAAHRVHLQPSSAQQRQRLAETKNGAVVRKLFGYGHIPQRHAARFNTFCREYPTVLNFDRLCLFATEKPDPKKPGASSGCTAPAMR